MSYFLGMDIGGTKCAVVLGTEEPRILARRQFPTETERGPEWTLTQLEETARRLLAENNLSPGAVRAIGISCGGPLDSARGLILSPPNLPGWDEVPLCQLMEARFSCPVFLENDANACALAEWQWGAGRGSRQMLFLTFGTGMGAGLILDGRLYRGARDLAGEVGHIRLAPDGPVGYGKAGSFEGFCSGGGIARLAQARAREMAARGETAVFAPNEEIDAITAREVVQAAQAGDPVALELMTLVGRQLGLGLAILVDILNPEVIVIGSIFARAEALLRPAMETALAQEALPLAVQTVRIVPAGLGEQVGDYATLAAAVSGLGREGRAK